VAIKRFFSTLINLTVCLPLVTNKVNQNGGDYLHIPAAEMEGNKSKYVIAYIYSVLFYARPSVKREIYVAVACYLAM